MLSQGEERELRTLTTAILAKLSGFFAVDADVADILQSICIDTVDLAAGHVIVAQDGDYGDVYLVDSGWLLRSRYMPNGTRQIVNTVMAGDFAAFNAMLFTRSDFELRCKTDVIAYKFSAERLEEALTRNAALSAALFWINGQEESMLAERIVSLGRRSARQRTAHVLCELIARMEIVGIESMESFVLPLSQDEFADILGISVVHMNKTLQSLRRDNIISFRNALLVVHDRRKLAEEAGFDSGYLHFTRRNDGRTSLPDPNLQGRQLR